MRVPMSVLKLMVGVPTIVTSALIWVIMLALVPPALGLLGFIASGVVLVLLATGAGEMAAARVLAVARDVTPAEWSVLAPVLVRAGIACDPGERRLLVRTRAGAQTPPAQRLGCESLIVTPWLIEATYRGRLSLDEAAALVVHAEGRHRALARRWEIATLAMTVPWHAGAGLARTVGRASGWVPFIRLAWACRGAVGVVALIQQTVEGRPALGVLASSIVALTYVVPAAGGAVERRANSAGDDLVVDRELGRPMARMLRRFGVPVTLDRLYRLEGGQIPVSINHLPQVEDAQ